MASSRLAHATFAAALATAPLLATAAGAPSGQYAGSTSQGQPVTLQFGPSPSTGRPALLYVEIVFALQCDASGLVRIDGAAVQADEPVDKAGGVHRRLWAIRFQGDLATTWDSATDTVQGTTSMYSAYLLATTPLTADGCSAPAVSFSAAHL